MKPATVIIRLLLVGAATSFASASSIRDPSSGGRRRRGGEAGSVLVKAEASIARTLSEEHARGNANPRLTLHAKLAVPEAQTDLVRQAQPIQEEHDADFVVQVYEPVQAVTAKTLISEVGGSATAVEYSDSVVLVADANDDGDESGTIAIVVVNQKTGSTNGIVYRAGQTMMITQDVGGEVLAHQSVDFTPPKWECSVGREQEGSGTRHLTSSDEEQHHRNHSREETWYRDHSYQPSEEEDTERAILHMKRSLRGSNLRFGKRRSLQGEDRAYSYQVDIFIEIDNELVATQGGIQNAKDYINSIVTAANSIYEPEVDTHLNVIRIEWNNNYDGVRADTSQDYAIQVVGEMQRLYAGPAWHFPGADLHHALLGSGPRSGYALYDAICDSFLGFGASTGLVGDFTSVDEVMIYDMYVFAHEIGHNFGARHTHDGPQQGGYDPVVDTCGLTCPGNSPDGLTTASATLMSYCNFCSPFEASIAYTFGGRYNGTGDRTSVDSYVNTPGLGIFNVDPRRVNVRMYEHVSTRGECTNITPSSDAPTFAPSKNSTGEEPYGAGPSNTPYQKPTLQKKRNGSKSAKRSNTFKRGKSSKNSKQYSKSANKKKSRRSSSSRVQEAVDAEYPGG